jgi:hypothetical protein
VLRVYGCAGGSHARPCAGHGMHDCRCTGA